MPTLRYKLDVLCGNCCNQQEISIPRGCDFVSYDTKSEARSGYMKYKTGHQVRLSCERCGCDTLGLDPMKSLPEHMINLIMAMGGVR